MRRLLILAGALLASSFASSVPAEDLPRAAKELRVKYAAQIEELAAWCEKQGLTAEAKKTRDVVRGPQDPYKMYLPVLPREVGPPALPADAPAAVVEWDTRLGKLRREQAAALYELARRAVRGRQASLAYDLVLRVARENPDHEGARRVFGCQKHGNEWLTLYEIRKRRAGFVWHDKFGWINKAHVRRYEQGQRPAGGGRWVTAEEDARLHRDIQSGWEVETEHYLIRSNHSIEAAVAVGVKLENLYRLWQQLFIRFFASETYVNSLFSGRGQVPGTEAHRFDVVYFRTRDDYVRSLRGSMPNVAITTGMYLAKKRTAYFFAGGEHGDRNLYHEATHQLFQQSRRVVAVPGETSNFWIVEGIAMFMETLHEEDGFHALGGLDDARMAAARYRMFHDEYYVPFGRLTGYGMERLQNDPKIAMLYSQAAAMTNFLVFYDGGRYRDSLVGYLSAVYAGRDTPGTLAELVGTRYEVLDQQYREFMEIGMEK